MLYHVRRTAPVACALGFPRCLICFFVCVRVRVRVRFIFWLGQVTALDGTAIHVTCTQGGFYVNGTRRDNFDPKPAANNPCHSHELATCLLACSPSFAKVSIFGYYCNGCCTVRFRFRICIPFFFFSCVCSPPACI